MPNKQILIFIDWFLPGYKAGGPIQSISNFIQQFKQEFDISVVTSDRDLGDTESYKIIALNQWITTDGYRIIYLSPDCQNSNTYRRILLKHKYDAIYFNSFFSVQFTIKPLLVAQRKKYKIVLAPRGMLGAGALQIKWFRKNVFIFVSRLMGLYKNITWHATAETEKQEIIKLFGSKVDVLVAPNLPSARLLENKTRKKITKEVKLFFVSRIAQKKNLLEALKILKQILPPFKVSFTIIGPIDEMPYWEFCKTEINQMPDNISTDYLGAIPNTELVNHLTQYHFLFLPTLHENYGHAIIESFQCGCPVIISDRTPWRGLEAVYSPQSIVDGEKKSIADSPWSIDNTGNRTNTGEKTEGEDSDNFISKSLNANTQNPNTKSPLLNSESSVGWDLPLEHPEQFVKVLEYCAAMDQEEYNAMSQRAFEYAKQVTENPKVLEANRRLFV